MLSTIACNSSRRDAYSSFALNKLPVISLALWLLLLCRPLKDMIAEWRIHKSWQGSIFCNIAILAAAQRPTDMERGSHLFTSHAVCRNLTVSKTSYLLSRSNFQRDGYSCTCIWLIGLYLPPQMSLPHVSGWFWFYYSRHPPPLLSQRIIKSVFFQTLTCWFEWALKQWQDRPRKYTRFIARAEYFLRKSPTMAIS